MGFAKLTATVVPVLMAAAITASAGNAAPRTPVPSSPGTVSGSDHGIGYRTGLAADRTGVTTTLTGGRFVLTRDRSSVEIITDTGELVARLRMAGTVAGHPFRLRPEITRHGAALTIRPEGNIPERAPVLSATDIAQAKQVGLLLTPVGVIIAAAIGGVVGAVIGAVVGLPFLVVGAIPGLIAGLMIGAGVGALAGAVVAFYAL